MCQRAMSISAAQDVTAVAVALVLGRDADVEHVRFAGGAAEHAIADDAGPAIEHPAFVADPQAVAEDAGRPGEGVGALFDRRHGLDIGLAHHPKSAKRRRAGALISLAPAQGPQPATTRASAPARGAGVRGRRPAVDIADRRRRGAKPAGSSGKRRGTSIRRQAAASAGAARRRPRPRARPALRPASRESSAGSPSPQQALLFGAPDHARGLRLALFHSQYTGPTGRKPTATASSTRGASISSATRKQHDQQHHPERHALVLLVALEAGVADAADHQQAAATVSAGGEIAQARRRCSRSRSWTRRRPSSAAAEDGLFRPMNQRLSTTPTWVLKRASRNAAQAT